ncbi:hypothetical protein SUGI_0130130 [Cryptomeria japonica]|nr:hypothetical protein SUGI_0130130 [Cryptomeria japonica]
MMEESKIQQWEYGYDHKESDCWKASFISTVDFNEDVLLLPPWNNLLFEEDRSGEGLMQITEILHEGRDEDLVPHDEIFSDLSLIPNVKPLNESVEFSSMEGNLLDVLELPDQSDEIMMDSDVFCEDSRDDSCVVEEDYSVGNTSASVECYWPAQAAALTLYKSDSAEYRGLGLVHLLIACAEAISDGAHDLVEAILCRLKELVSPTGTTMERVSYYLTQSLEQRLYCSVGGDGMEEHMFKVLKSTKDPNYLGAFRLLNQVYPYIRFAHFTANQSILEAIPAQAQGLHILDFDIMEGLQWPPLMEALKSEKYKIRHLKITAVKWDNDDHDHGGGSGLGQVSFSGKETGRRLSEYACSLGIPFSFQETQLENLEDNLSCSGDEMVAVNCMWELPHMLEHSPRKLSEFLEGAHHLNPVILTLGTGPSGLLAHKKINLLERFTQCLKNLCALFDSMEAGLSEQYGSARTTMERLFMAPMACRPIHHLSEEDGEFNKVVDIPLRCGFAEDNISNKSKLNAKIMAQEGERYRVQMDDKNQLLLLWQSTPLMSVSTWKPTNYICLEEI